MNSYLSRIDVLDALDVVPNCQTYYLALNRLLYQLNKCMK